MEFILSDDELSVLSSIKSGWNMPAGLSRRRKKEMLMLRFDEKWPIRKIADRYDISRERVRQIIGNTGKANGGFHYSRSMYLQDIDWENDYLDKTDEEIARIHNVSAGTINLLRRGVRRQLTEDSNSGIAISWEEWTSRQLSIKDIPNDLMSYSHPFDILAFDKVRIDVKVAFTPWKSPSLGVAETSKRWRFAVRNGKKRLDADFYILVIAETKTAFVVPSTEVPKSSYYIVITWPARWNRSKYIHYRDRWDLIGDFANAHSI